MAGFYNETTEIRGIGKTPNKGNKRKIKSGLILLPSGTTYASSVSTLRLEATLEALVIAKNAFPIMGVQEVEAKDTEDIVWTGQTGDMVDITRGKKGLDLKVFLDEDQIKTLYTYEGKNWDAILFDSDNNIYAKKSSTSFKGFTVSRFKVATISEPSKDIPGLVTISIQFEDQNEFRDYEAVAKAAFSLKTFAGVLKCTLTSSVVATNAFTVSVNYVSDCKVDNDNAYETVPITGLLTANFEVKKAGVVEAPVSVAETAVEGAYLVTMTATFTTGTIRLLPTSGALYESEALTVVSA